jgi:hypothetical protein
MPELGSTAATVDPTEARDRGDDVHDDLPLDLAPPRRLQASRRHLAVVGETVGTSGGGSRPSPGGAQNRSRLSLTDHGG